MAPLDSPGAYFRNALRNGYGSNLGAKAPSGSVKQQERKVDLHAEYAAKRTQDARGYYAELSHEEKGPLIEQYNGQQTVAALRIQRKFKTSADAAFHSWLGKHVWGEPSDADLITFASELLESQASKSGPNSGAGA